MMVLSCDNTEDNQRFQCHIIKKIRFNVCGALKAFSMCAIRLFANKIIELNH